MWNAPPLHGVWQEWELACGQGQTNVEDISGPVAAPGAQLVRLLTEPSVEQALSARRMALRGLGELRLGAYWGRRWTLSLEGGSKWTLSVTHG